MRISLKTDTKEIQIGIIKSTRSGINSALHLAADDIRRDIVNLVDELLTKSPEYASLLNGTLKAEFGIADPEPSLREILNTIKGSVGVSVVPVSSLGGTLRGGITITMLRSGFQDILNLAGSSYQGKSFIVPWLDWLLLQGDRVIVAGYHITYNLSSAQKRNSLTGVAIMEKGGGWRVPSQFAGTEEDNWLTRTLNPAKINKSLGDIVEKRLTRRL